MRCEIYADVVYYLSNYLTIVWHRFNCAYNDKICFGNNFANLGICFAFLAISVLKSCSQNLFLKEDGLAPAIALGASGFEWLYHVPKRRQIFKELHFSIVLYVLLAGSDTDKCCKSV